MENMFKNHKYIVLISTLIIGVIGISASLQPGSDFKNLRVLPKDITEQKLDSIMDSYCKALNVGCDFCHEKKVDSTGKVTDDLDFAADGIMKENARGMITLMIDINTRYFYYDKTIQPAYLNAVSCNTCHRGNPFPLNE